MKSKLTILTVILLLCGISVHAQVTERLKTEREKTLEYFTQKALSMKPASLMENEGEDYGMAEDWRLTIDNAMSHPKIESDAKIIRLAEGTFAGICTIGDSKKIFVARLVKLDANGEIQWSRDVEGIMQAEAKSVAQGVNGTIYVAGRMVRDNSFCAFVAEFTTDGTQKKVISLYNGEKELGSVRLKSFSDGVVCTCPEYLYSAETRGYVYKTKYTVLDNNLNEVRVDDVTMDGYCKGVWVIDNYLIVASDKLMCGANITTGQNIEPCKMNGCLNAVLSGKNIYALTNDNVNQTVVKFAIADDKIIQEWEANTSLPKTTFYSMLVVNANQEVVAVIKNINGNFNMVRISNEGVKLNAVRNIFQDNNLSKSYCYGMDFDDEGNVILTGMGNNFQVYIAKFSSELAFKEAKYYIIGDPAIYSYSYMRDEQPIFFEGKMACACYIRKLDRIDGHFPYFAQWDLAGETSLDWAEILQPGNIPDQSVVGSTMDSDGNILTCVSYNAGVDLCKYSATGELAWSYRISALSVQPKTLSDGSFVFADYNGNVEQKLNVLSKNGEKIWSKKLFSDEKILPQIIDMEVSTDNEIYVVAQKPSEDWSQQLIVVEKYDGEGNLIWNKTLPHDSYGDVNVQKCCLDIEDNLVLCGTATGNDYVGHPSMMKVTKNGEVIFHKVLFTDSKIQMSFVDVWTDKTGNILCAGGSNGNSSPLYAAFDKNGDVIYSDFDPEVSGYYTCVGSINGNAVFSGVFSDDTSTFGRVLMMAPDGKEIWSRDYRNGNAMFTMSAKVQPLVFAGYTYDDNNNVREIVVTYDENGDLVGQCLSDLIFNPKDQYILTSISGNVNSVATTSTTSYGTDIRVGFLTRFVYKSAGIIGVDDRASRGENIEIERYSIDGRCLRDPQPGVNIIRMSDGTSRKVIVR